MKAWCIGRLQRLFLCGLVALSSPGELVAGPAATTGDADLRLVADASGVWVEGGNRDRESVPTGTAVEWRRIEPIGEGWIAVGSRFDRSLGSVRERLVLVLRPETGAIRELPEPGLEESAIRSWPVPIVQGRSLRGLAWLEGDHPRGLAVRAAPWNGDAWGAVVTIAPPGPGTQTALAGTTLADGRAVLVWSAFDGVADEIVWSVGFGSLWTEPAVLHEPNEVPDVIPAVVAAGEHVFAAWSRFDGSDYRLRLAEWSGEEWLELDWVGGRGSLFPSFVARDEAPWLVYGTTVPQQWNLVEVAVGRGAVREAAIEVPPGTPLAARPLVVAGSEAPEFVWFDVAGADPVERRSVRWRDE